jgi:uroporphyrinogen-III synthase
VTNSERSGFEGLRVAGFESRRAAEMTRLLETAGAAAFVSPAMRELPLKQNEPVLAFARGVIAGDYDIVVLMAGVGFRFILRSIEGHVDVPAFLEALSRITTVARGPKPVAALKEAGLSAGVRIGEPNTWRDILAACRDEAPNVRGARIAIQEHGLPTPELQAGLEALGASVTRVPVYQWALPEDLAPLEANLRRIVAGEIDIVLFTSSRQVLHVLIVAQRLGIEEALRGAMSRLVIGSIGPTTSETLRESGFAVAFEPEHPKLGYLVGEAVRPRGRAATT